MNGSVGTTLGAILLGGQLSFALSGAVAVQTFLYFRMYPKDALRIKATVVLVWVLDSIHTALMSAASWDYLIVHFGDVEAADYIPTTIALTVAFTAAITLVAHLFFTYRVFRLSKSNWCITAPLVVLTFCRLLAAMVSTVEMVHLRSFHAFTEDCGYLFTLGLSISSALDILIVCALCYFLQHSRTGFGSIDHVIDTIMIYTLNNGALTCLTTIVSMICWLTMPRNFIFLGLHFGISKLYANSLLSTLNTRKSLRGSQGSADNTHVLPVLLHDPYTRHARRTRRPRIQESVIDISRAEVDPVSTKLQINAEKTRTIQYNTHGEDLLLDDIIVSSR